MHFLWTFLFINLHDDMHICIFFLLQENFFKFANVKSADGWCIVREMFTLVYYSLEYIIQCMLMPGLMCVVCTQLSPQEWDGWHLNMPPLPSGWSSRVAAAKLYLSRIVSQISIMVSRKFIRKYDNRDNPDVIHFRESIFESTVIISIIICFITWRTA